MNQGKRQLGMIGLGWNPCFKMAEHGFQVALDGLGSHEAKPSYAS